jgi:hypothetical protein
MPLAGVKDAAAEYHAKKEAAESGRFLYFKLDDGEEAQVRFLEEGEDFTTFYVHKLPQQGNRFPEIPCLNQKKDGTPCPGCEEGIKRSFKFAANVIWRDGPVYERDNENKLIKDSNGKLKESGRADGVFVWTGGIQVAEDLDHLDGKYRGLKARDFEVSRSGKKLDTKYRFLPAEQTPLSDNDKKLMKEKFDLNQLKKPPSYEEFFQYQGASPGQRSGNSEESGQQDDAGAKRESPFKRRQRTAA